MNENEHRDRRASGAARVRAVQGLLNDAPVEPAGAAGDRRFVLRSSVEPFPTSQGDLYLLRSGDADLLIRDADHDALQLVHALAGGPLSMSDLATQLERPQELLRSQVDALDRAGVLSTVGAAVALDPEDASRFVRQLPYLAEHGAPEALQRGLRDTRIVVLGCGGLGSWIIAALAATGIGGFVLVDDDAVELSNLNRQILYATDGLGTPKVEATRAWLRRFDPRIDVQIEGSRIRSAEDVSAISEGSHLIVLAADSPPYVLGRWVNQAAIAMGIPFVTAGQAPPILKVGPIYWPGRAACFACHETLLRTESGHYDDYVRHAQLHETRVATLGPASGLIGTAVAMEILQLLIGAQPATLGGALTIDLRTLETHRLQVPRDSDCAACQHLFG